MARPKKVKDVPQIPETLPEVLPDSQNLAKCNDALTPVNQKDNNLAKCNDQNEIDNDSNSIVNFKIPLTDRELTFMDIVREGKLTPEKAVESAGYDKCSRRHRFRIAAKIIKKYEQIAGGARNIFRDIGFGEFTVAGGIKKLGMKSKSAIVQLRAHELAARALGMLETEEKASHGVTVIIQGPDAKIQVNANQAAPTLPSIQRPAGEVIITD
jgi:hypothetical protein